jgi:hypothetical protein
MNVCLVHLPLDSRREWLVENVALDVVLAYHIV